MKSTYFKYFPFKVNELRTNQESIKELLLNVNQNELLSDQCDIMPLNSLFTLPCKDKESFEQLNSYLRDQNNCKSVVRLYNDLPFKNILLTNLIIYSLLISNNCKEIEMMPSKFYIAL